MSSVIESLLGEEEVLEDEGEVYPLNEIEKFAIKALRELDICLISREQLELIAEGRIKETIKTNANEFMIEWIYGKPMEKISLEEAIEAIKKIWISSNIVRRVEVRDTDEGKILFFHSKIKSKLLDESFCKQIKLLLESNYGVNVDYKLRTQGYLIRILTL
ncbi:MAG: hypothetical protein H0Z28_00740 [Archaeoglobus sp.]|nr:hypothetical protein [Archaeoglobus sp.]